MPGDYNNQAIKRFSRHWWVARGQSLFWVVLVTVLVWVYADMEFTQTQEFNVVLDLKTGPNLICMGNKEMAVIFKAQGNRNGVDKFEQFLKGRNHHLTVDVSEYSPGRNSATIEELLGKNEVFNAAGISIVPGSSAELHFELDRVVTKTVPVQFEFTGAKLTTPANVQPKAVDIRCGSSQWKEIDAPGASGPPAVKTQAVNLREFQAGKPQTVKAQLVAEINKVPVEIVGPSTVSVDFQIEQITSSAQVKLNVRVLTPRSWMEDSTWKEYELQISEKVEWQPTVKVVGPQEALEQLTSRAKDIKAFIELNDDDKAPVDSWNTRSVIVHFPRDLKVELDPTENPTVKFKMVKK